MTMKLAYRRPVFAPVTVRALVHDASLLEQALEHEIDTKLTLVHVAHADGQVFKIYEDGNKNFIGHCGLLKSRKPKKPGPQGPVARHLRNTTAHQSVKITVSKY